MNLYIIRHGNPDYCNDVLTDLGHKQAEAAAQALMKLNIDEVHSSPMGRARQTAQHFCDLSGKEMIIEPWAEETEYYCYNGNSDEKVRAVQMDPTFLLSPEVVELGDNWPSHPAFCGEENILRDVLRIENGTEDMLNRLGYEREGERFRVTEAAGGDREKNVALFCHAGMFLPMTSYLLRLPRLSAWHSFFIYQCSITWCSMPHYDSGYTVARYLYINDTRHLAAAELPLT